MSDLAQQLIAENKRTRDPFLDLGNCGLSEVPAEVGELVWLESLSFASNWSEWNGWAWRAESTRNRGEKNNRLLDLGPLGRLTGLRLLIIEEVADLSPLAGLTTLQRLYINDVTRGDLGPLAKLTALQALRVSGSVSDLTPLAGLSVLGKLDVSNTQISDLSTLGPLIRRGRPVRWSSGINKGKVFTSNTAH